MRKNDMSRRRITNILLKEWQVLFTDVSSTLLVTVLPFLIVGQGTLYIWLASNFGGEKMLATPLFQTAISKIISAVPAVAALPGNQQIQVLLLTQFNFFLLLIPTMVAVSMATFSIVDEKQTGSLEALLATPVRTWELLLGKALAGAIPAIIMTWISAGVFLLLVQALGWGHVIGEVVTGAWFLHVFLLAPAIAVLSFIIGVMGSSKAKDAKSAQNMILIIVLPVFALIAVQVTGIVWFTPLMTFILGLVLLVLDIVMLRAAVRLFRRESILVQWR
jgi:ABC-2 type transport system permease protein